MKSGVAGCGKTDKKKQVKFAEIVVHGTAENPCYGILYQFVNSDEYHLGYGSRDLSFVFEWLDEYFEIVGEKDGAESI